MLPCHSLTTTVCFYRLTHFFACYLSTVSAGIRTDGASGLSEILDPEKEDGGGSGGIVAEEEILRICYSFSIRYCYYFVFMFFLYT